METTEERGRPAVGEPTVDLEHGGVLYIGGNYYCWCDVCAAKGPAADTKAQALVNFQRSHAISCTRPTVARSERQRFWLEQLFSGRTVAVPARGSSVQAAGLLRPSRHEWVTFKGRLLTKGFAVRVRPKGVLLAGEQVAYIAGWPQGAPQW